MLKSMLTACLATGLLAGICCAQETGGASNEPLGSTEVAAERWYLPDAPVPPDLETNPFQYGPAVMYQQALQSFEARDGEAAAYWAYLGQLRYRTQLACDELGPWTVPFDTFQALNADIGAIVNEWLGGDVQLWVDTLTRVTDTYETADDPIAPSPRCDGARTRQIAGARQLRRHLIENYTAIRAQRAANGLENRTSDPVVLREE